MPAGATGPAGAGMMDTLAIPPRPHTGSGPARPETGAVTVRVGRARARFTVRVDGDMVDPTGTDSEIAARRRAVVDRPWTWLRQVHGARVIVVSGPADGAGAEADGAVSARPGVALAVLTADCGPLVLASPEGIIGAAHAGWRGLLAGVIPETVAAMRELGATQVMAALGPCIRPECYPFGAGPLDQMAGAFGDQARSVSRDGGPALDLPGAVAVALRQAGAELVFDAGICTACSPDHWSWRAGQDTSRQAAVVWLP